MKKRILSILLCCMMLMLLPTYAAATETEDKEQFNLEPGKGYYYFYIEEWKSYVRFNYAGTVDAYVLNSRSRGKQGPQKRHPRIRRTPAHGSGIPIRTVCS